MFGFFFTISITVFSQDSQQMNTTMEFNVFGFTKGNEKSNRTYSPLEKARVIIIGNIDGNIITHGLTNKNGQYTTNDITINTDQRFPFRVIGTVTIIVVADGFNEYINFSASAEYEINTKRVYLEPLLFYPPHRRNEPKYENGDYHRHTVFKMLNYYAKKIGLLTQKPIKEYDDLHWSPNLMNTN
jgi:hypothetical protein